MELLPGGGRSSWLREDALNFFLVSDGIRAVGVLTNGGNGQKHQCMASILAQISTKATRLMVRVRGGVLEAF